MRGIFDGVRVVELASGIAAPYATMFLADHGAEVVKVERPSGDPYRGAAGFQTVNRNKRSVVAEPGDPDQDDLVAALLAGADVVVTDHPGRAAELRSANPGALIVTMPPWGERGPYVTAPATPDLVAAAAGIFWNQQSYTEAPVQLVVPVVAYGTAALGALALAVGLFARERDGVAPCFEVSWVAGAAAIQLGETQMVGVPVEERAGSAPMGGKGRIPCYRLFQAGDGRWFFLACGTPRFFQRLLEVIGRADLIGDPRLPDPPWGLVDPDALAFIVPILEEAFATRPREAWLAAMREADIPAQPVQTREEFRASHLAAANHLEASVEHPELGVVDMMGVPLVMEAAPGEVRRRAPLLGEHTDEVRGEVAAGAWPPQPARPPATGAPLAGTRAIDLAGFIAGPVVSRHLAMLGSEVVKVEPPSGDPFRAFGPMFAAWNQGKRSVALDLQQTADQQRLYRLVEGVDVVVENFRPGVATRLGCDDRALRAVNPDLVTLSSSGYGDDASMASVPAFDPLLQALGGIMAAQGGLSGPDDDGEPVFITVAVHDVITPLISAFGLVSGLYDRLRTGRGQRVRTSLAQTSMAAQAAEHTRYPGSAPSPLGGFDHLGAGGGQGCVEGRPEEGDGWWFVEGELRTPIVRTGLINQPIAADNGLCVTEHHPQFGEITQFGQLVVGAGPPPRRGPLLDEHRAGILGELPGER